MFTTKRLAVLGLILGVLLISALAFLFRTRTVDLGDRGLLVARYKWGRLTTIEVDENRDGETDLKQLLKPGASLDLLETWSPILSSYDTNLNGHFDILREVREQKGLKVQVYWIDKDHDGNFDEVLCGDQGREYLSQQTRARSVGRVTAPERRDEVPERVNPSTDSQRRKRSEALR